MADLAFESRRAWRKRLEQLNLEVSKEQSRLESLDGKKRVLQVVSPAGSTTFVYQDGRLISQTYKETKPPHPYTISTPNLAAADIKE